MERSALLAKVRSRLHLVPRTVRLRLTLLYGGVILVSGTGLLAITFLLGSDKGPDESVISGHVFGGAPANFGAVIEATRSARGALVGSGPTGPLIGVSGTSDGSGGLTISQIRIVAQLSSSTTLHNLFLWSGVALAIVTVLGLALGWIVSGRVLRPLRVMTNTAQHISEENLHQRLDLGGPSGDELKELGDTIDGLLGRLESAFDAQGRFVQNASHELRTPLAMMQTSLDVATAKPGGVSDEVTVLAAKLQEGLDQAERLLESFLVLARVQQGGAGEQSTVALADLVDDAVALQRGEVARLGLEVRVQVEDCTVLGSETLLTRLVANLVDNAVRHNEAGGWLAVSGSSQGSVVRLVVENGGLLIDQSRVDLLGQPFQRLGSDRTGSANGVGLGLSIVGAISHAHGGTIELSARHGGGLQVVVELPASRRHDELGARR